MSGQNSTLERLLGNVSGFSDEQITQTINLLLQHATTHHATDVHIEPREHFVLVRYRIGGIMKGFHRLPSDSLRAISNQIKRLARLSQNEMHSWQEGHFSILSGEDTYEIKANIMPVLGGEKIVLHLARERTEAMSLEEIGFWGKPLRELRQKLARPHGLILVSTPRHSGKSSTIAALLGILNTTIKIVAFIDSSTVRHLPGVVQNRVRPQAGITHQAALHASIAQDSDIIGVTSLPDKQTAQLALEAATSGHLIIAGNYAYGTIDGVTHLRTTSGEPYLLAKSLSMGISHRLVRRLCNYCAEQYQLNESQIANIVDKFGVNTVDGLRNVHTLEQQARAEGLGKAKNLSSTPNLITHMWRPGVNGCEHCSFTGYGGQMALCEVLITTDELRDAIAAGQPGRELHKIALKDHFIPLALDGLIKALRGLTTVEEILRVL